MKRIIGLTITIVLILSAAVFSNGFNSELVIKLTGEYIESFEWDTDVVSKSKEFSQYKELYLEKLKNGSQEEIFLSAIMLGLLNENNAVPLLQKIESDSTLVKIGLSFSLCSLPSRKYVTMK